MSEERQNLSLSQFYAPQILIYRSFEFARSALSLEEEVGGLIMSMIDAENTQGMVMSENRRNLRWIDPNFQRRYSFLLLSVVLLVSTVLIGTFWYHSDQVLKTLTNAGVVPEHSLYLLVQKQMHALLWSVCAVVGLFCVFVFVVASFLSHRIVGPIFAIKRSLEFIGRGNFSEARVTLRSDDEFQDVASLVNQTVDQLEKR